jgi:FlaA1/EpsC-like NDP-sugar epimerase/lipopolysaccharide/colanic/teichoic acid biosynthesis glycosyltransferase
MAMQRSSEPSPPEGQPMPMPICLSDPVRPPGDLAIRRYFDLIGATLLGIVGLPMIALAMAAILVLDGRPLLHGSTRIGRGGVPFRLWKLRTLRPDPSGTDGASGGHLDDRGTWTGPFLRRTRIDELPQIWNILRGDMGLVGPRPPLSAHVALRPDVFATILALRPGITGLATLRLHGREARLLADVRTRAETEAIYARRILPAKLRIEQIYARRRCIALDLRILAATAAAILRNVVPPMPGHPGNRGPGAVVAEIAHAVPRGVKRGILLLLDAGLVLPAALSATAIAGDSVGPLGLLLATTPALALLAGTDRQKLLGYGAHGVTRSLTLALAIGAASLAMSGDPVAAILLATLHLALATGARLALLHLWRLALRGGRRREAVLLAGAEDGGLALARALALHRGLRPVAFIEDNPALTGLRITGLPVVRPDAVGRLAQRHGIRRVFAAPDLPPARAAALAADLARDGLRLTCVPAMVGAPDTDEDLLGRGASALPPDPSSWAGQRILVTGAGGSIGSELCRQLLACQPAALILLDSSEAALYQIDRELRGRAGDGHDGWHAGLPVLRPVIASVTDEAALAHIFAEGPFDTVLHAAALKHVGLVEANPAAGVMTNVLGTRLLASAARAAGTGRFVLVSTDKAVAPAGIMGATKRLAEIVVQDMARRPGRTVFATVRFGNVLGSSGSVVPLFREQIARGGPVTITDLNATRYLMTIPEAAHLTLAAAAMAEGGEVFALDMGAPVRVLDIARRIAAAQGLRLAEQGPGSGDIPIAVIGLGPGEKQHERLSEDDHLKPTAIPKILRATPPDLPELAVAAMLRDLQAVVERSTPEIARTTMRWAAESTAPVSAPGNNGASCAAASLQSASRGQARRA